jgi:tRNA(fMet)-specific endonuclease VapC
MSYLIDTDISLFSTKGKFGLQEKFERVGFSNCWLSEITKAELLFSVANSGEEFFDRNKSVVDAYFSKFALLPISNVLPLFAAEKSFLYKKGLIIPDFDLLIGVTSIYYNLTLVTHNTKHFSRLRNIRLEDWVFQ